EDQDCFSCQLLAVSSKGIRQGRSDFALGSGFLFAGRFESGAAYWVRSVPRARRVNDCSGHEILNSVRGLGAHQEECLISSAGAGFVQACSFIGYSGDGKNAMLEADGRG